MEGGIMSNARKTTVVRIERPFDVPRADFVASIRSWLGHQCIILADDLKGVALANIDGVDAEFDNPRDARLFERRFVSQPIVSRLLPRVSIMAMQTALRSWVRSPAMPAHRPAAG
jgi:hypothetical protein